ncbi:FecR family protein [Pseudomonas deceptionensis]|uniref:FecR family protein n=1 Tax=Pseudomonas deceptionensis TaxID=882211 RepID=A0A0J6GHT5_PSEDM|nr:FecR family protein [Pseudomonas deceptionensis]KMM81913.1 siderophore-interacting protein [Pseudomonas deceptionensis]SEE62719.1 FecR family protein [Pseudomonas deceptionensis]
MSQGPEQQIITEAAAEWAVRLHAGALSEDARAQLDQWLAADERHAPALRFAEQTWAALGELALEARPLTHRLPPAAPRPAPVTRRRRPLRWVGRAAGLSLVLAVGWISGPTVLLHMQSDYRTGVGELRTVQLDDGSSVELDASSAISIDYDTDERRVSLLAGSAVFDVAPMGEAETRPFVVQSAGGRTRALGTQFVVGRESSEQAWVGVLQHSVAVSLQAPPAQGTAQHTLEEGHSVRYSAEHGIQALPGFDLSAATSWRRGMLVFDRQPLGQVVEQLNRYRPGQIVLANPALASRQVSGVFRLELLDSALQTLTRELHIQRIELAGISLMY